MGTISMQEESASLQVGFQVFHRPKT